MFRCATYIEDMMSDRDADRALALKCPTCAGGMFRFGAPEAPMTCNNCGRSLARDELVEENGERIEAAFEEMAPELLGGAADKVRKALAKAFRASKSLGFK